MKRILLLLLVFGIVFSASFPQQISGTDLQLLDSTGTTENGEAYYANSGESTAAMVVTQPLSSVEWLEYAQSYSSYGWDKKTDSGMDYYYYCEESYGETYCMIDFHSNEVYHMIDVYMVGGSSDDALNIGIKIGKQIAGGGAGVCPCPIGLLMIGVTLAGVSRVKL